MKDIWKYLIGILIYNILLYYTVLTAGGTGFEDMFMFLLGIIITIPVSLIIGKVCRIKFIYSLLFGSIQVLMLVIIASAFSM